MVVALDEEGNIIASAAIVERNFTLEIDPDLYSRIRLSIGDAVPTGLFDVGAGALTEVSLDLSSSPNGDTGPADEDLLPPVDEPPPVEEPEAEAEEEPEVVPDVELVTLPNSGSGGLSRAGDDTLSSALLILIALLAGFGAVAGLRLTRAHD